MRFGQNLHRYQVVEWAPFYVDYQLLKQQYKTAHRLALHRNEAPDLKGLPHLPSPFREYTVIVAQTSELPYTMNCPKQHLSMNGSMKPSSRASRLCMNTIVPMSPST